MAYDQPKNWRAPTRELAGRPFFFFWQAAVRKVFADKFFWSRPFVLVFTFLIDRTFGYVDVRQAATIVTQKEPFLTRPDQPSSSSLARRVCVLCIHPSTTRGKACSVLVLDGRVSEVIGGILEGHVRRRVLLDSDTVSGNVETFVVLCAGRNPWRTLCVSDRRLAASSRIPPQLAGSRQQCAMDLAFSPSTLCFFSTKTQMVKFDNSSWWLGPENEKVEVLVVFALATIVKALVFLRGQQHGNQACPRAQWKSSTLSSHQMAK